MKIKIADLQNNHGQIDGVPENPRYITDKKFDDLKQSLTRNPTFIERNPLLIYDNHGQLVVIGGNMRLKAMQALGWKEFEHTTPILKTDTPVEQIREEIIEHNTEFGSWDWDMISNEWDADNLLEWGVDMPDDWGETKELPADIDEIPSAPKTPISKLGDLWLLGNHRVLCGDSTDRETVERLMDGKKADMVFTDPPYGMNLDTDYTKMAETKIQSKTYEKVIGDDADYDASHIFDAFADCKEIFLWGADWYYSTLPKRGSWIVWDKRNEASDGLTGNHFEMLWSKQRHRRTIIRHLWAGFTARNADTKRVHPTEKPVKVLSDILERYSQNSAITVDLFLGSGSTLIACEQTDRICYGLELDPAYVDVIVNRWCKLTGKFDVIRNGEKFTWPNQDQEKA